MLQNLIVTVKTVIANQSVHVIANIRTSCCRRITVTNNNRLQSPCTSAAAIATAAGSTVLERHYRTTIPQHETIDTVFKLDLHCSGRAVGRGLVPG